MVLERKGGMLIGSWSTADGTSSTISFQPIPELSAAIDPALATEGARAPRAGPAAAEQASDLRGARAIRLKPSGVC